MSDRYKLRVLAFLLFALVCFAPNARGQGLRLDSTVTQEGLVTTIGLTKVITAPSNPVEAFCNLPANSVHCSNRATAHTLNLFETFCSSSTQVLLAGRNSCVGKTDSRGERAAWVPAGEDDHTSAVSAGQSLGPHTLSE